jgi:anti-sigma regulatory factor (Ser/Thr protein kinase)
MRRVVGSGAHAVWTHSARVELDNDIALVGPFVDQLVRQCAPELDEAAADELRIALRELLTNAIEHGNLMLSYEDKSRLLARGLLRQEVERRRAEADEHHRKVDVWVRLSDEAVMVQIGDGGDGFDWQGVPDVLDPENLLADHGRGIMLARLSVDHLHYNDLGNQVTIVKRIPARCALAVAPKAGPR